MFLSSYSLSHLYNPSYYKQTQFSSLYKADSTGQLKYITLSCVYCEVGEMIPIDFINKNNYNSFTRFKKEVPLLFLSIQI
jgi:hypothetical protein